MPSVLFPLILFFALLLSSPVNAQEQTTQKNIEVEHSFSSFFEKTKGLLTDKKRQIKPLIDQSHEAYVQKDYHTALKWINQAIEIDSQSAALYNNRGLIQLALKHQEAALKDLEQAIQYQPRVAIFYNTRGTILLTLGRYQQALEDFNQALRLEPEYLSAYNNRGLVYVALGQNEQALQDFNTVLKQDSSNTAAYNNRGLVMLDQQKVNAALDDFNAAILANPRAGIAYNNRGIIYHLLGQKKTGNDNYDKALEFEPVYFSKNAKIGDPTYIFDNDFEKAMVDENLVSRDPKIQKQLTRFSANLEQTGQVQGENQASSTESGWEKYFSLFFILPILALAGGIFFLWWKRQKNGELTFPFFKDKKETDKPYEFTPPDEAAEYLKLGLQKLKKQQDYKSAITNFNYAIEIAKNYMEAYYHRGVAKAEMKDYKGAIEDYTKAIKLDPENSKALNNRGCAYLELAMYQEALKDFTQAVSLKVDYALAYNNRGNTYYEMQAYQQAIDDYSQALIYDKKGFAHVYHNNRGNAKSLLKQYNEAILDYNEAIHISPSYITAYINRGHAKYEQGDQRTAMLDYNRARQLYPNENFGTRDRRKQNLMDVT